MLLLIEGFEGASSQAGGFSSDTYNMLISKGHYCYPTIRSDAGRLAGVSFLDSAGFGFVLKYSTVDDTVIIGFGFKSDAWPGVGLAADILQIMDTDENVHLTLQLYDIDEWRVVVPGGTYTTVASTGAVATWFYLECKIRISAFGSFEFKVDNVTELSGNPVNTKANISGLSCFANFISAHTSRWYDDIYICDSTSSQNNDFLGNSQIIGLFPDANGSVSDFTPSAGDNFENVDELDFDGDTTYNTGVGDDIDYYTYDDLTASQQIRGVQINTTVRATDAGIVTIRNKVQSVAIVVDGEDFNINISYSTEHDIVIHDPATSAFWTLVGLNAAEFGVENVLL